MDGVSQGISGISVYKWDHCYDQRWQPLLVEASYAHPAKFSRNLIERIYRHLLDRGWLSPGEWVADPFGGVACGGVIAGYMGLNWLGVELESDQSDPPGRPFVEMGEANLSLHRPAWEALGLNVQCRIVQGDSRNFAEIVTRHAPPPSPSPSAVISSPPYVSGGHHNDVMGAWNTNGGGHGVDKSKAGYGKTPGQIGQMKEGDLRAVVTSPPYGDVQVTGDRNFKSRFQPHSKEAAKRTKGYGNTIGQIGDRADSIITSPPFNDQTPPSAPIPGSGRQGVSSKLKAAGVDHHDHWGQTHGQIGTEAGSTYWSAMQAVYSQMLLALKPGGVAAIVLKDHVREGQRVHLCDQTLALLAHVGFEPVERIRAMLVTETSEPGIFGEEIRTKKERKSFFKRLHESKGSPAIDWEEVLVCRKPQS